VLVDNPLLTLLGRRGRGAVVEALLRNPTRIWRVRELARFADVAPMVASRAAKELAALGAIESLRPGRNARIRWRPDSAAGRFLASHVPDLRREAADAFATAFRPVDAAARFTLLLWRDPRDDPADPLAPARIAVVASVRTADAALDAAGPALDAVRNAGLPAPEVSLFSPTELQGNDATAVAVRSGLELAPSRARR
jgi:hypothetical protein